MLVLISVFSYILLIIILIVFSKGTMVNSDTTSNDTIWYPGGIFRFFSVFINDLLFLILIEIGLVVLIFELNILLVRI